jgi:hypothetical protein
MMLHDAVAIYSMFTGVDPIRARVTLNDIVYVDRQPREAVRSSGNTWPSCQEASERHRPPAQIE